MLVRWALGIEGVQSRCLEPGRIWSNIPLNSVWSDHLNFLKTASICDGFQVFFKLVHSFGMIIFGFWILWFFRRGFSYSKLFLFPSECSEVVTFLFFTLIFAGSQFLSFSASYSTCQVRELSFLDIIDRLLLGLEHMCFSCCTQDCSLNFLAISSGVLAIYAKASISTYKFDEWDSATAECSSFVLIPWPTNCSQSGQLLWFRFECVGRFL